MNNSEYPTFSFERKNKKKNDSKKENTLNQIDNTFMKIFPLETKTNIEFPLPNFNDILMKISELLQPRPISILTKFQGHSLKIGSATSV